jgi:WhiB family transcriptional regulator, redox-sensing transcriptional regulator
VYDRRVIPTVFFVDGLGRPARDRVEYRVEYRVERSRVEGAMTVRDLFLLEGDAEEPGWQERALCAQTDPEAFFPEKGGSTREAKKVCLTCDVRGECLEYALLNDERFGIWGGLSERERRKLKKRAV